MFWPFVGRDHVPAVSGILWDDVEKDAQWHADYPEDSQSQWSHNADEYYG